VQFGGKRHKKVLAYESARFKAKSQTEKPNSAEYSHIFNGKEAGRAELEPKLSTSHKSSLRDFILKLKKSAEVKGKL